VAAVASVDQPAAERSGGLRGVVTTLLGRGGVGLRALRREEVLRLGKFGELLGRRETLNPRRQHGVRVDVAIDEESVRSCPPDISEMRRGLAINQEQGAVRFFAQS